MIRIDIKPISVNEAWQGRRFKTSKYTKYERDVLYLLPKIKMPEKPYKIEFEFGFSNSLSDWDNPIKQAQDIICKKYGIKDSDIYEGHVFKKIVKKGKEYFKFKITTLKTTL